MLRLLFALHAATRLATAARREASAVQARADGQESLTEGSGPAPRLPVAAVAPLPIRPEREAA